MQKAYAIDLLNATGEGLVQRYTDHGYAFVGVAVEIEDGVEAGTQLIPLTVEQAGRLRDALSEALDAVGAA